MSSAHEADVSLLATSNMWTLISMNVDMARFHSFPLSDGSARCCHVFSGNIVLPCGSEWQEYQKRHYMGGGKTGTSQSTIATGLSRSTAVLRLCAQCTPAVNRHRLPSKAESVYSTSVSVGYILDFMIRFNPGPDGKL